ncbi:hypothetical protein IJM86_06290 [bacterium]|nr:hypothetical protein [bacterium]
MGLNDNETILTAQEKTDAKAEAERRVYTQLSDDIKSIVDDLKDGTDDSQSLNKMQNLSSRLDQGFYNYCETTF